MTDLLLDGIISGVGGVLVFLPNILILYFFISLMEDSGYLSRAAFIMDKIMHKMGLHGKSFVPMLMGFGCNVPAIMATRTLESKHSRLITMLVIPFMSCTARLPVYVLFSKVFFPEHASIVMLSLYVLGILVAVISARIFKRFMIKGDDTPFVMELPPYRVPTIKSAIHHMWEKSVQYLKKMGTLILFASIIIWALGYFPMSKDENVTASEQLEQSYIGRIGKFIEPVIEPFPVCHSGTGGCFWALSVCSHLAHLHRATASSCSSCAGRIPSLPVPHSPGLRCALPPAGASSCPGPTLGAGSPHPLAPSSLPSL